MWLLTCDGDILGHKPLWLRPGEKHLFGRTTGRSEDGERVLYIQHKSVSRKHLTFEVSPVEAGDGTKLLLRSVVTLKDASKIGTTLNGEKFNQQVRTVDAKENVIKLGSCEDIFRLVWTPVVLSLPSLSKKAKEKGRDPHAALRQKLEQADIKAVNEYVTNETTHVLSTRRNTPTVLQALAQARWVVSEGFMEALAAAIESPPEQEKYSPLGIDFHLNWPSEMNYPVPVCNEPHARPDVYLKPDRNRVQVFASFTFLFLSQKQYNTLHPAITAGGGKAVLYEIELGSTSVHDLVNHVKEIAGHKGSEQFLLSQYTGPGGVVVVRLNDEPDQRWRDLIRNTDLALDQRSIEQNEFLDALLMVDASVLRRQLEEEPDSVSQDDVGSAAAQSQERVESQQRAAVTIPDSPQAAEPPKPPEAAVEELSAEQEPPVTRRRNRRVITQSRFKGFDDFDPSQFSKPVSTSPEPPVNDGAPSQAAGVQSTDHNGDSQPARSQEHARKRPPPVEDDVQNEADMYASLLTGQAAMKRRRLQEGQNGSTAASSEPQSTLIKSGVVTKKKAKELDVMAEVQARRQREDEQRRKDDESVRQALDGVDISELKNLAKVEQMDIPIRQHPPPRRGNDAETSNRWNPAWNGRKNFKKFRPQGERRDAPRLQRVILTLEEVPRKGHGIGEEYWLNSTTSSKSNKAKSQSQSQSTHQQAATSALHSQRTGEAADDEHENTARFRRRVQNSRAEDEAYADVERDPDDTTINGTPSQTLGTESQRKTAAAGGTKRPAVGGQSFGQPPAKRSRQSGPMPPQSVINLDDDDDDELKFRRRRRV